MKVVDCTCDCKDCVSRTKELYRLKVWCGNCKSDYIAEMRKGDEPPLGIECPYCGVSFREHYGELVS